MNQACRFLDTCSSIYELAHTAIAARHEAQRRGATTSVKHDTLDYDPIYDSRSEWRLLPAIDHPEEPSRCLISGTGLNPSRQRARAPVHARDRYRGSYRQHENVPLGSRRRPPSRKETSEFLPSGSTRAPAAHCAHMENRSTFPLMQKTVAKRLRSRAFIWLLRMAIPTASAWRWGMNFPIMNSKRRIILTSRVRNSAPARSDPNSWLMQNSNPCPLRRRSSEMEMFTGPRLSAPGNPRCATACSNIEHHHFKFEAHRRPGDVHVHFFGTDCLSFSDHIRLQDGDVMQVAVEGYGRPLRNPVRVDKSKPVLINVIPLR